MPVPAIVGVRARHHPGAGSDIQWNSPATRMLAVPDSLRSSRLRPVERFRDWARHLALPVAAAAAPAGAVSGQPRAWRRMKARTSG